MTHRTQSRSLVFISHNLKLYEGNSELPSKSSSGPPKLGSGPSQSGQAPGPPHSRSGPQPLSNIETETESETDEAFSIHDCSEYSGEVFSLLGSD